MPNFNTKNALHGYLSPKMFYLGISGQEFKEKLLPDLKSTP